MTINLALSPEDARFLREHLQRHIAQVDDELVHTDRRALQHEIASDLERLKRIESQLAGLLAS
jgi:uncharacterized protein YPO0396